MNKKNQQETQEHMPSAEEVAQDDDFVNLFTPLNEILSIILV